MLIIVYIPLHLIRDLFLVLGFAGGITWMAISDMQFSRRIERLWREWMREQGYPLPDEEEEKV